MKKLLTILLIALLFLAACTKESVSDTELTQTKLDVTNIPMIGTFNAIDLEIDLSQSYYDMNARQIDSNHILIWSLHYDSSFTNTYIIYHPIK